MLLNCCKWQKHQMKAKLCQDYMKVTSQVEKNGLNTLLSYKPPEDDAVLTLSKPEYAGALCWELFGRKDAMLLLEVLS